MTTLDRFGRSTRNMLVFAEGLRLRSAGLRVLNLGGGELDTSTPMAAMVFTMISVLPQMELDIKMERVTDSVAKRRTGGGDRGGRPKKVSDRQISNALDLIEEGESTAQVLRDLGLTRSTFYRRARGASGASS